jgi:hypothetical protein
MPSKPDALAQGLSTEASLGEMVRGRRAQPFGQLGGPAPGRARRKAAVVREGESERPASEPAATTQETMSLIVGAAGKGVNG